MLNEDGAKRIREVRPVDFESGECVDGGPYVHGLLVSDSSFGLVSGGESMCRTEFDEQRQLSECICTVLCEGGRTSLKV